MIIKKYGSIYSFALLITSILSAYIFNVYNNITLQIILLIGISVIPFIICDIRKSELPFVICCVSLSLLFNNSLISNYIWGWDINHEYKISSRVLMNNYWDINTNHPLNSMLTTVILSPMLSLFSNLSIVWIFKIVYPLIFSLVPVIVYLLYSKFFEKKIAIFSTLFLIFTVVFYTEMLQLVRQQIAEFIFMLICYFYMTILIKQQINKIIPILIVFIFTLVISHYGLTYIFLFVLFTSYLIYFLSKHYTILNINFNIPFYHIILFLVLSVTWYTFTSLSRNITTMGWLFSKMVDAFMTDVFSLQSNQALNVIMKSGNVFSLLNKSIAIFFQVMILIGIIITLYNDKKKINTYYLISMVFLIFLIFNIFIPYLSNSLNITRIYHISLLILSSYVFKSLLLVKDNRLLFKYKNVFSKIIPILLIIYFSFNNGLIYYAFSINDSHITLKNEADFPIFSNSDVISANWIVKYNYDQILYADQYRVVIFNGKTYDNFNVIPQTIPIDSLIYLNKYNTNHNTLTIFNNTELIQIPYSFKNTDLIYNNVNSKILHNQQILSLYK